MARKKNRTGILVDRLRKVVSELSEIKDAVAPGENDGGTTLVRSTCANQIQSAIALIEAAGTGMSGLGGDDGDKKG